MELVSLPAAEPHQVGFYAYEQLGCSIYDAGQYIEAMQESENPGPLIPLTEFTVGQRVAAGSWYFTITVVDKDTVQGENEGLLMLGFRRDDGSWGSGFGSKTALLRAEF